MPGGADVRTLLGNGNITWRGLPARAWFSHKNQLFCRGNQDAGWQPTPRFQKCPDISRRWEIETLFAAWKTRGFCLEATHLTAPERLDRLVALLALTFCLCHKLGEWLHQHKALKLKKHGRPPKSLFRRGFDHLRRLIVNFTNFDLGAWQKVIKLLSCT
jgi:hypothetical protein